MSRRADPDPGPTILLTGGTGFLGSHLGADALARGREVLFLTRPGRSRTAAQRVERLLDWHGIAGAARERARCVDGDITESGLGVAPAWRRLLGESRYDLVHCASDTSFSERDRERVWEVNVGGLERVLGFASETRPRAFHLVSTAYVAGRTQGRCAEELTHPRGFHNPYEESKCRGEWLVTEWCRAESIPLTIYRPSVVCGHSRTGRTLQFNAMYYPVRVVLFLRKLYESDVREFGGMHAEKMGVRIEPDGSVVLPIRIEAGERGSVNLIPVDHFVEAFFAIMEAASEGGVFHIVSEEPAAIEGLVEHTMAVFGIAGLAACPSAEYRSKPGNSLERLFEHYVEAYGPYMRDERSFSTERAGPILRERGIICPAFDRDMYRRCMEYAVRANWRSELAEGPGEAP